MKHKPLADALNEIRDEHITEALKTKKRALGWAAPVAAVLALSILAGVLLRPKPRQPVTPDRTFPTNSHTASVPPVTFDHSLPLQYLAAKAEYPHMCGYPLKADMDSYTAWRNDQQAMHDQPDGYADSLDTFWSELLATMADGEGNMTCSPVNIYMALALLAETTDGSSRQQILDALGAPSIQALRTQAQQVWKAHYNDDGLSTSILANSLWLDRDVTYNSDTVGLLAEHYYASVFQGELGSEELNQALRAWLDQQTGGLLGPSVQHAELSPLSVLALASTIYYKVQWANEFQERNNTQSVFHAPAGDMKTTFMNTCLTYGPYYWDENFGAVYLYLEDGSKMWLLLPDEGVTPQSLLADGSAMAFLTGSKNEKSIKVNLSVPKFDIAGDTELSDSLKKLGITDIFSGETADFSPLLPEADGGFVSQVQHAARVAIDEKGVTAAAFTVIERAGAAMPPEEEIDFTLDRPFLFIIESRDGLPLFTGIVNQP